MILKPRQYQIDSIDAVTSAWKRGVNRPAVVLPTGAGKAQPTSEPVLTPDGWKTMGQLRVGDHVVGSDGRPTKVTGVFPQGQRPVVRMDFDDGSWTRCDEEHLWSVRTRYDKYEGKPYRTLKASEIRDRVDTGWYVPFVGPVRHPEKELPLDPYLLGALLGDGGISGRTILFTGLPDSVEEVRKTLPPGIRLSEDLHSNAGKATSYRLSSAVGCSSNNVLDALRVLKLHGTTSRTKFIPRNYLETSVDHRTKLLQGLMDTDGHVSGTSLEYSTVSPGLAMDVKELVRSLGGRCRLRVKETSWTHNGQKKSGNAFRLTISLPGSITPVRLPRKISKLRTRSHEHTRRVTRVVSDGYDNCVCISVDAADSLYVTRDHLVTHNTVTFAHLIHQFVWHEMLPGDRVLVLVNRDELARQAAEKIRSVAPDLEVGIVKAEQNDVDADVIVGSVQTLLRSERRVQIRNVAMVVVDECHYSVTQSYMEILEYFGIFEETPCVGYTATMSRSDSIGLGDLWQEIVYERDTLWGIVNGFLVDVEAQSVSVDDLNLAEIARSRGDYQEGKLGDALIASGAADVTARAYLETAKGRQGLIFTPTVAATFDFARAFNEAGIKTESVIGETPPEERQRIYERYRNREIDCISSCSVLTTGFDMPQAEVAVMARPTTHPGLRIQCIGRVLRPHPTKRKPALVLDVVGAVSGGALNGLSDLSRTDVVPDTGETLLEALERSEEEAGNVERDVITGKVTRSVVKLFEASPAVWVQTRKGSWCIPTRKGYVVLMPVGEGQFRVAKTHSQWSSRGEDARWLTERPMSMELAMAWSEQLAMELDPLVADKSRDWRANRRKPTQKQFDLADRLGIKYPEKIRKGELARLIDEHQASRILDPR